MLSIVWTSRARAWKQALLIAHAALARKQAAISAAHDALRRKAPEDAEQILRVEIPEDAA